MTQALLLAIWAVTFLAFSRTFYHLSRTDNRLNLHNAYLFDKAMQYICSMISVCLALAFIMDVLA